MRRIKLQFINNTLLLLALAVALLTGIVSFVFSVWLFDLGHYSLLGLAANRWSSVHRWAGIAAVPFVIGHLALYWRVYLATGRAFARRPGKPPVQPGQPTGVAE